MISEGLDLQAAEWETLSTPARIARCLQYAEEAEQLKQPTIAAQWRIFAAHIESKGQISS